NEQFQSLPSSLTVLGVPGVGTHQFHQRKLDVVNVSNSTKESRSRYAMRARVEDGFVLLAVLLSPGLVMRDALCYGYSCWGIAMLTRALAALAEGKAVSFCTRVSVMLALGAASSPLVPALECVALAYILCSPPSLHRQQRAGVTQRVGRVITRTVALSVPVLIPLVLSALLRRHEEREGVSVSAVVGVDTLSITPRGPALEEGSVWESVHSVYDTVYEWVLEGREGVDGDGYDSVGADTAVDEDTPSVLLGYPAPASVYSLYAVTDVVLDTLSRGVLYLVRLAQGQGQGYGTRVVELTGEGAGGDTPPYLSLERGQDGVPTGIRMYPRVLGVVPEFRVPRLFSQVLQVCVCVLPLFLVLYGKGRSVFCLNVPMGLGSDVMDAMQGTVPVSASSVSKTGRILWTLPQCIVGGLLASSLFTPSTDGMLPYPHALASVLVLLAGRDTRWAVLGMQYTVLGGVSPRLTGHILWFGTARACLILCHLGLAVHALFKENAAPPPPPPRRQTPHTSSHRRTPSNSHLLEASRERERERESSTPLGRYRAAAQAAGRDFSSLGTDACGVYSPPSGSLSTAVWELAGVVGALLALGVEVVWDILLPSCEDTLVWHSPVHIGLCLVQGGLLCLANIAALGGIFSHIAHTVAEC
ncbi:hypothetical protein KIPB_010733, partial [Kipferlia bialata]